MLNLAQTHREAENPEAAASILDMLISLQADNPEIFSAMGLLQEQMGEPEKAENYLPPPDGHNETYHEAPDWLKTEEWCDIEVDW